MVEKRDKLFSFCVYCGDQHYFVWQENEWRCEKCKHRLVRANDKCTFVVEEERNHAYYMS